jgi:membrane fusion protein (multidrug efflux system)
MPTSFSRSLRSLEADRSRTTVLSVLTGMVLLSIWGGWFLLSDVALYEISEQARLEVEQEPHKVMSLVSGRVVRNEMLLGRVVKKGELLVELDADEVRFQLEERRAEASGLESQLDRLRRETGAQESALAEVRASESSALAEARARHQEALAAASFAEQEASRHAELHRDGLISRSQAEASAAEARAKRQSVAALQRSVERLQNELRFEQSEKQADVSALERRAAEMEASLQSLRAVIGRLERELSLHTLRAPTDGRIGDAERLRAGEIVEARQHLGSVIPEGGIRAVAEFPPRTALGRIQPGQRGRLRLEGFPWVQYGSVSATVTRVASEPLDGLIRVELAVQDPRSFTVPLHHGLPGILEVEVERVSPAALVLRAAGRLVSRPVESNRAPGGP